MWAPEQWINKNRSQHSQLSRANYSIMRASKYFFVSPVFPGFRKAGDTPSLTQKNWYTSQQATQHADRHAMLLK
jgi:hypothetical protein